MGKKCTEGVHVFEIRPQLDYQKHRDEKVSLLVHQAKGKKAKPAPLTPVCTVWPMKEESLPFRVKSYCICSVGSLGQRHCAAEPLQVETLDATPMLRNYGAVELC